MRLSIKIQLRISPSPPFEEEKTTVFPLEKSERVTTVFASNSRLRRARNWGGLAAATAASRARKLVGEEARRARLGLFGPGEHNIQLVVVV